MTTVRIEDCRDLRYCTEGMRRFAAQNGLDFRAFVRHGIPAEQLPPDDVMVKAIIAQAQQREAANGQG